MPKRRANGEGNIRKRKDGRWEGRYTAGYDPESGKRIIKNVLGKTQAEVKEKLKAAISESQRLDVSKAGTYTVSSWMKMWYEVYAEPRIRPNTKAYYTNYIENHIIPGIGNISLDKLTTIQIQRFYNNLQKSGRVQRKNFPELKDKSLSPRVVRGVHTLLPTAALAAEPNASETPDAAELNGMDNDDTMAAYETRFRRPMTPTRP